MLSPFRIAVSVLLYAAAAAAQPLAQDGKFFVTVNYSATQTGVSSNHPGGGVFEDGQSTIVATVNLSGWMPGKYEKGNFYLQGGQPGLLKGEGGIVFDAQVNGSHGGDCGPYDGTSHGRLPLDVARTKVSFTYGFNGKGEESSSFDLQGAPLNDAAGMTGTSHKACDPPEPAVPEVGKLTMQMLLGHLVTQVSGEGPQSAMLPQLIGKSAELGIGQFAKDGATFTLSLDKTISDTQQAGSEKTVITMHHQLHVVVSGKPPEDPELSIDPRDYAHWLPQGSETSEAQPGNAIPIFATLLQKDGKAPQKKVLKIIFELTDVSKEPGVCLNQPPNGNGNSDFDLRFRKEENPELTIEDPKGQRAVSQSGKTSAVAVLSSFDWGAYGALKVTAELVDGTVIAGILKGQKGPILLPKREAGSHIATAWKEDRKVSKAGDDDDLNAQDGNDKKGDGFTLYEEYRGVLARGKHVYLDPKLKNLLVENKLGAVAGPGIKLLGSAAGLNAIELSPGELAPEKVVNINQHTSHGGDQHGLRLVSGTPDPGDAATMGQTHRYQDHPIHSPKDCQVIEFGSGINGLSPRVAAQTVAHELAHGCGVSPHHHGDSESLIAPTYPRQIAAVYTAKGVLVPVKDIEIEKLAHGSIAAPFSASSGDPGCLMTYNHFYSASVPAPNPDRTAPNVYILAPLEEPVQDHFCTSEKGSGWNAPDHKPMSIYGNARAGNCQGQFGLKDW